jgi:hypothetical protein
VKREPRLPDTQRDVLAALVLFADWARPMDVGATDGSHHTATLHALMRKGFVERRLRGSLLNNLRGTELYERLIDRRRGNGGRRLPRGSYEYRATSIGRATITAPGALARKRP